MMFNIMSFFRKLGEGRPVKQSIMLNQPSSTTILGITGIGSCFSEMVINCLLEHNLYVENEALNWQLCAKSVQQRSDVVADFTQGIFPDTNIIQHYLSRGKWLEHKVEYAKWFTNYTLQQISQSIYVIDHTPDILLLDSLCDVRHTLCQHQKKKFKALLGNVDFDDVQTKAAFDSDFTFIGLLTPEQSKINLEIIFNFFLKKNPDLQIFYMHFPFMERYLEAKWLERAAALQNTLTELHDVFRNNFTEIRISPELVKPITDPLHPNYSPQVWNHFYPEVYNKFAQKIIDKVGYKQV